jgi:hypothetical protein
LANVRTRSELITAMLVKRSDTNRPHRTREIAMVRPILLGAAAVMLSVGAASAQAVYPGYGYAPYGYGYVATAPLYDYAAPAYGYAAPTYVAPVYPAPPVYAVPAPLYGYYAAPYGYPPGSREWVIERGW